MSKNQEQKNSVYGLYILEEIRTVLYDILQVDSRIYDHLAGYVDEQTHKDTMLRMKESVSRLRKVKRNLDNE